jgi:hypothetical protein
MTHKPAPRAKRPPALAWHIYRPDGSGETVVAHACHLSTSGALAFHNTHPELDTVVLVRAFSARMWDDVELLDTPNTVPIQLSGATATPTGA